jgi:hypothetical protein
MELLRVLPAYQFSMELLELFNVKLINSSEMVCAVENMYVRSLACIRHTAVLLCVLCVMFADSEECNLPTGGISVAIMWLMLI